MGAPSKSYFVSVELEVMADTSYQAEQCVESALNNLVSSGDIIGQSVFDIEENTPQIN